MKHLISVFAASLVLGCGQDPAVTQQTPQTQHVELAPAKSSGVIAFHSDRSGIDQIYAVNPDGTDLHLLPDKRGSAMFAKWSANGDLLAYTLDQGRGPQISFLDLGNPNTPMLLLGFDFKSTAFSWSPDGRFLAYHGALKPAQQNAIYVYGPLYSPSQSELMPLTGDNGRAESPSWSPDGHKIAFQTDRDGNWEIYVMNADGSGPLNLTRSNSDDRLAAWSPDGRMIAFTSNRDGNEEIYAMNSDGTGVKRLTDNPAEDSYPSWSPDGTQIAFQSSRSGNMDIFIMNSDGSNVRNLTNNAAVDAAPSWGGDGRIYLQRIEERVRSARAGDIDSLSKLLKEPIQINARDGTLLNEAILAGQTRIVEMLLKKGADPNLADGRPLIDAVLNHHPEIVMLLLGSGADPNGTNPSLMGPTPLSHASAQGDLVLMHALLEKGAKVDINDYVGSGTALIGAIESNHPDAVELLLQHQADPSIYAKFHGYPFDIARENKNQKVLDLLRKYKDNCVDRPEKCN
jgi:Tol biopolymer transport system component